MDGATLAQPVSQAVLRPGQWHEILCTSTGARLLGRRSSVPTIIQANTKYVLEYEMGSHLLVFGNTCCRHCHLQRTSSRTHDQISVVQ